MEYIYMYNEYTLYNNAPIALKHVSCLHVPSLWPRVYYLPGCIIKVGDFRCSPGPHTAYLLHAFGMPMIFCGSADFHSSQSEAGSVFRFLGSQMELKKQQQQQPLDLCL